MGVESGVRDTWSCLLTPADLWPVGCRSQRLQFDVSSPNGILLFRETSKMITTYGRTPSRCSGNYGGPEVQNLTEHASEILIFEAQVVTLAGL